MQRKPLLSTTITMLFMSFCIAGCPNSVAVPDDAQIVWSGILDQPNPWRNLTWEGAGQLYLVEGKTGRVIGVRTVWPEQTKFSFSDLEEDREYRLYFRSDPTFVGKTTEENAPD